MPNIKSAKKRLRQNIARRAQNRAVKSELRTLCRRVRDAVVANDLAKAETEFRLTVKQLDRAGAGRVIHPNAAARLKSRLSARIRMLKQPAV
jgi:small subunit ribosomal protein S20